MKQFLLLLSICLTVATSALAQNGGQSNENNAVRIDFGGFYNQYSIIKVTNKQSCTAQVKVTYATGTVTKSIAPVTTDTVRILLAGTAAKVQAKAQTNCGNADFGNVELLLNIVALPIKFTNFYVRKRIKP